MRRAFVTNLALVLVLNLLVKPFYILGIDAEVQVRVGTAAYGDYAALLSLGFLLNILLDLGITNWNTRHIARDPEGIRGTVGRLLVLRGALAVLYGVVLFVAAWLLGFRQGQLTLLAILAVNQMLAATVLYLRSNIAGAQRYAQDSLLSVLDRALLIGLCAWLLWGGGSATTAFRIEWFAWAQTVAYGITAIVALGLVSRRGGVPRPRWDAEFIRSTLRACLPYALLVLLMTFYYRTDTVMLERLLPDGALQAGIYAQAFRFFEALNMLGFLLAGLLLPMFSRLLKDDHSVAPLAGLAMRLVVWGAVMVAVVGSVYAENIMALRYVEHVAESASAFRLLVWGFTAVCVTYVYGTLLTAGGDLRTLNWIAAGGMVLNIALNAWLIPRHRAEGAALAGLITQGLTAFAQVLVARRQMHLPFPGKALIAGLSYLALLLVASTLCERNGLSLWWAIAVVAAVGGLFAVLTSWLPVRPMLDLLRPVR